MSAHVKNLAGMTVPGGEPQTVLAKLDTTHSAIDLVVGLEHKADIERPGFAWVIEHEPILTILPGINEWIKVIRGVFLDCRETSKCWEIVQGII